MVRELGVDIKHLPSWENVFWAGVGGGAAAALHPLDPTANADLSGPFLDKFFKPGAILGQSYTLLPVAATIYVVGRAGNHPRISHMGSDLIQSILIAELMTQTIEFIGTPGAARSEQYVLVSVRPRGRYDGVRDGPGAALQLEVLHPRPTPSPRTFAMSRLHDNRHFASDVAFGSAVGIIAGRTVTRYGHRPFPVAMTAVPGGFAVVYYRQGDSSD